MRTRIWICLALFLVVMLGVRFAAHGIVDNFGWFAGVLVILAMYAAARVYDQR